MVSMAQIKRGLSSGRIDDLHELRLPVVAVISCIAWVRLLLLLLLLVTVMVVLLRRSLLLHLQVLGLLLLLLGESEKKNYYKIFKAVTAELPVILI